MTDVRELLARLNPTTIRMNSATGGGVDALTNIDIAGALGMVPAGLGRDLLELLHGPNPSRVDIVRTFEGIARLAMEERNRRSKAYVDARTTWGIAECMANFDRRTDVWTRRNLEILKARADVARGLLLPESLEQRMPQIAALAIGYMKGGRLSNRERAATMGVSESAYRQGWVDVVEWIIARVVEAEQTAARQLKQAVARNSTS